MASTVSVSRGNSALSASPQLKVKRISRPSKMKALRRTVFMILSIMAYVSQIDPVLEMMMNSSPPYLPSRSYCLIMEATVRANSLSA